MADYRIEFSIQRRKEGDGDFTEIGFGSSTTEGTVNQAAYMVESIVQNRAWETSPGMPDPDAIGLAQATRPPSVPSRPRRIGEAVLSAVIFAVYTVLMGCFGVYIWDTGRPRDVASAEPVTAAADPDRDEDTRMAA